MSREFLVNEREHIQNLWLLEAETWVFEQDGNAVGFLSLIGDEVGAIFVYPEMQGSGIGRALMDHAVTLRGGLSLDVFEDNAVGRRFYDKYGFEYEHKQIRLSYRPRKHGP